MNRKAKEKIIIGIATLSLLVYLSWRVSFTIPWTHGMWSVVLALLLIFIELLGGFELLMYYYGKIRSVTPVAPDVPHTLFPHIDIFITTYNEPEEIVAQTLEACIAMRYPDTEKVHIYVCDDGRRDKIRALARRHQVGYLARTDRRNAKAGNLNHALFRTDSPLVATFDADMIPDADFLMKTVPFFFSVGEDGVAVREEKVGFVQTPQGFYHPDLFQYYFFGENRMPNEQDYFYRDIEMTKNGSNSVIYGGSNTVLSRQALRDAGGFSVQSITEDFATGLEIQAKGYSCYALEEVLARGIPAGDLQSLTSQRQRWARGCIQTGKRLSIFSRKDISSLQKINYIISVSYWYFPLKQLVYLSVPLLVSLGSIVIARGELWQLLSFWFPMFVLTGFSISVLSRGFRSFHNSRIYELILSPLLIGAVVKETVGRTKKDFVVTPKKTQKDSWRIRMKLLVPLLAFAVLTFLGIVRCVDYIRYNRDLNQTITLFWLLVNFYFLLACVFFSFGRSGSPESIDLRLEKEDRVRERKNVSTRLRKDWGKKILVPLVLVLITGGVCIPRLMTDPTPEIVRGAFPRMERGINIGNAFEAPRGEDWGMHPDLSHLDKIADAGFDHIRLPVRFSDYATGPDHQIEDVIFEEVDEIIDHALSRGLSVTLDLHHFQEIMNDPERYREKFLSIWEQLSEHYAAYPKDLVFEILNEPIGALSIDLWNAYVEEAIGVIREKNPTRIVIVGGTFYYSVSGLRYLELPEDPYIMAAFHYYEPNDFAFQGNPDHEDYKDLSGVTWRGTEEELAHLAARFDIAEKVAEELGVRMAVNEFGVTRGVPDEDRALWIEAVRKEAESRGFSWCYWEFGAGFGIFDTESEQWDQIMLDALLA